MNLSFFFRRPSSVFHDTEEQFFGFVKKHEKACFYF